ncbi:helix-turn-helix transcriptional regulator [Streptococcus salivarius]
MDIATLIKEYRIKTGMTQQELADKVFVTRQTISKWELGKSESDNVSLELLFKEMNIEKESQKDIKANLISRKKFLLTIIAVLFSPSILIIRLLVLKIGKIENKRLVILINTLLFIIIGIYMKSLKDNVYFGFLGIIAIAYSLYSFYKLSLELELSN